MLIAIMFAILGTITDPGTTYWVVLGIFCVIKIIEGLYTVYKLGKGDK